MNRNALLALASLGLVLAGCPAPTSTDPALLRVSAIPDQNPANVRAQHLPLLGIACAKASVRCEWIDIDSYQGVVDALGNGSIDVAFLGGATFVRAREEFGAIPLAIRDVDTRFSSTLVVRADSSARRLEDLRGKPFSFGNRSSTSGHVMARYFLTRAGIEPERHFSRLEYSPNHDETLARVASGSVAAGISNSAVAYGAMARGGRYAGVLRVVWETPPYIDYVWVARRDLPEGLRSRLVNAFLDLDRDVPEEADALRSEGAGGFLPPRAREHAQVAEALRQVRP